MLHLPVWGADSQLAQEAGFEVVEAAIRTVHLDAVLTDLAMPEVGGRQLAQRLQETLRSAGGFYVGLHR